MCKVFYTDKKHPTSATFDLVEDSLAESTRDYLVSLGYTFLGFKYCN